jgi:hypothetical protein
MKKEKTRDMIRSILPSKARGAARIDKALLKRAHRRDVRIDVSLRDFETTKADFARDVSLWSVVWDRRAADKLNHFIRWCEKITAGLSAEEKLGYVKGLLPRNLIGDHAYSHWQSHVKRVRYCGERSRTLQSMYDSARFHLRRALEIDPDLQRRLNAMIKSRKLPDEPRRLLLGFHDIDAFLFDIIGLGWKRQRWERYWMPPEYAAERAAVRKLVKSGRKPLFEFWGGLGGAAGAIRERVMNV